MTVVLPLVQCTTVRYSGFQPGEAVMNPVSQLMTSSPLLLWTRNPIDAPTPSKTSVYRPITLTTSWRTFGAATGSSLRKKCPRPINPTRATRIQRGSAMLKLFCMSVLSGAIAPSSRAIRYHNTTFIKSLYFSKDPYSFAFASIFLLK